MLDMTGLNVSIMPTLLKMLPDLVWEQCIKNPFLYAVGGTILAADLAIEHGFSINLSGGYHHANKYKGGHFCLFADIQLAVHKILEKHPDWHIIIVDLDAHQGTGHAIDLVENQQVHIFDMYVEGWPNDHVAKEATEFGFCIPPRTNDVAYLAMLEDELPKAVAKVKPNFIIYNAGTDILDGDQIGGLKVSEQGVIKRDEIVFKLAIANNIPIEMLLASGYTKQSANVVGKSIQNLLGGCIKTIFSL